MVVVPVPTEVMVPGYRVSVHVPLAGNPFISTLPVEEKQVGGVIAPTIGADGISACAVIMMLPDEGEIHPA